MSLPPDVIRAIERFAAGDRARVRALLDDVLATTPNEPVRVVRCVVWLGRADLAQLAQYAAAAKTDYRDVIWWAEYDGGETRLRDFTNPLP